MRFMWVRAFVFVFLFSVAFYSFHFELELPAVLAAVISFICAMFGTLVLIIVLEGEFDF